MSEHRSVPVPDGLEGERLDAALGRLFGLSRSKAVELLADGRVRVDGEPGRKSDRVRAG
jgi:23S rRNA pseudouridine1911/1915/1917 synthase